MSKRKTLEEFIQEMKLKRPTIEVLGDYINNKTGVHCKCKICGFSHYIDGKQWKPTPTSLLHENRKCPACIGQAVLQGFNDLATLRPDIAAEWNYEKNTDLSPNMVTLHSNKKMWWKCSKCGHEWRTAITHRSYGAGCPKCWDEMQTSFPEQAILFYCKQITDAKSRWSELGSEIDIYLPRFNTGVEYNGSYWHKNANKTESKIKFFKKKNIRIIVIADGVGNIVDGDVITHDSKSLDWAINALFELIKVPSIDINTKRDAQKIYQQYLISKKENSFGTKYSKKALEWDNDKNEGVTPYMVSEYSEKRFWRICPKCNKSHLTSICSWTQSDCCKLCANAKQVYLFDNNGLFCQTFSSGTEASRTLGLSEATGHRRCADHKPLRKQPWVGYTLWFVNDFELHN
jgi:hypothetical protein